MFTSRIPTLVFATTAVLLQLACGGVTSDPGSDDGVPNDEELVAGDECNNTSTCRRRYGASATDCANSQSTTSVCMCGAQRCSSNEQPPPTSSTDDCNTTSECVAKYGAGATDCSNSQSSTSVCLCGTVACSAGGGIGGGATSPFTGRLAYTADGNDHDPDDLGASPMALALLAKAGLQQRLVFFGYNNHIWGSLDWQAQEHRNSVNGAITRFGYSNPSVFFDVVSSQAQSKAALVAAINASSETNPLHLVMAGPMEFEYQAIAASDPSRRQFVTVYSHSTWNDNHALEHGGHSWSNILSLGVKSFHLGDQNSYAFGARPQTAWSWLNNGGAALQWLYTRLVYKDGDPSDAGMIWYLLKGNQQPSMTQVRDYLLSSSSGTSTPPPPTGTGTLFEEVSGLVAVEAEHFASQDTFGKPAYWRLTTTSVTPSVTPDPDPSHASTASGGAYLELLPDTRVTDADLLVSGSNFCDFGGQCAVLNYRVYFNTPGRYYARARAFSTGGEDNGLHLGVNGTWPSSGARIQWCDGKYAWTWSGAQRTSINHCGVENMIYIDIPTAGEHRIAFSMREDGFEFDKFVLTRDPAYFPTGIGPAERARP